MSDPKSWLEKRAFEAACSQVQACCDRCEGRPYCDYCRRNTEEWAASIVEVAREFAARALRGLFVIEVNGPDWSADPDDWYSVTSSADHANAQQLIGCGCCAKRNHHGPTCKAVAEKQIAEFVVGCLAAAERDNE